MDKKKILLRQNWKAVISQAINESDYFIALISSNSVTKRGYAQKELKIALDLLDECSPLDIFILPVRLDDCKLIIVGKIKLQKIGRFW